MDRISLKNMELNHLRYFHEVAKSGSFTEAARRLHVSQSALSKAVALLEESEGVRLFERSKKGVSLTPTGSQVFERTQAIFRHVTEIEETCRGLKTVPEGYLRFGASEHLLNHMLILVVSEMSSRYPKIIPSIFSSGPNEVCASILNGESEFGLFFTRVHIPQFVYESILPIEMALVCRPDLLSKKRPTGFAQLRKFIEEHGYICSIGAQYQHHPSEGLIRHLGEFPRVRFESNSQEAQKRFCIQAGGVAYLARFLVEAEIKRGELAEYTLPKPFYNDILLARRKARPLTSNAQAFLELFRSRFVAAY